MQCTKVGGTVRGPRPCSPNADERTRLAVGGPAQAWHASQASHIGREACLGACVPPQAHLQDAAHHCRPQRTHVGEGGSPGEVQHHLRHNGKQLSAQARANQKKAIVSRLLCCGTTTALPSAACRTCVSHRHNSGRVGTNDAATKTLIGVPHATRGSRGRRKQRVHHRRRRRLHAQPVRRVQVSVPERSGSCRAECAH